MDIHAQFLYLTNVTASLIYLPHLYRPIRRHLQSPWRERAPAGASPSSRPCPSSQRGLNVPKVTNSCSLPASAYGMEAAVGYASGSLEHPVPRDPCTDSGPCSAAQEGSKGSEGIDGLDRNLRQGCPRL